MKLENKIGGDEVLLIKNPVHHDLRGSLFKPYSDELKNLLGRSFDIREVFYSISKKNVVRGMHFQVPPHDHAKIVSCLSGEIIDVVVDLRRSKSTYGQVQSFRLSAGDGQLVYIPTGFAHGFVSLKDESMVSYFVTSVREPTSESGILWNSINFDWPVADPLVSDRDRQLPRFDDLVKIFN